MISFLINKNLCFYYWLRKRIGKKRSLKLTSTIEKTVLIFRKGCNTSQKDMNHGTITRLTNTTYFDIETNHEGSLDKAKSFVRGGGGR